MTLASEIVLLITHPRAHSSFLNSQRWHGLWNALSSGNNCILWVVSQNLCTHFLNHLLHLLSWLPGFLFFTLMHSTFCHCRLSNCAQTKIQTPLKLVQFCLLLIQQNFFTPAGSTLFELLWLLLCYLHIKTA